MGKIDDVRSWARKVFLGARLGDRRRTQRLVAMTEQAARMPGGLVSKVFDSDAGRQAAYDFLESPLVEQRSMQEALGEACAREAARSPFAFVAIDGVTLTITDRQCAKDFGSIGGPHGAKGRGLKAINALGMDPCGQPLGIGAQRYWARARRDARPRHEQRRDNRRRHSLDRETRHWVEVVQEVGGRFARNRASAWFVLDREADANEILRTLAHSDHRFTVRSSLDRVVETTSGRSALRDWMRRQPVCGRYGVVVASQPGRQARKARMEVRVGHVALRMRIGDTRYVDHLPVNVVWAREVDTVPEDESPLDWMLLTNFSVADIDAASLVVFSYTQRWRIEEMHKTWKSGLCGIEQTQLRSRDAVIKWATIMGAVAARAERLKQRSREQPDLPASAELDRHEIRALILLKRPTKKRTEEVPDSMPTLAQAVRWLADLGGYTGKSSGGPPGTITIGRGLQRVRDAAAVLRQLHRDG